MAAFVELAVVMTVMMTDSDSAAPPMTTTKNRFSASVAAVDLRADSVSGSAEGLARRLSAVAALDARRFPRCTAFRAIAAVAETFGCGLHRWPPRSFCPLESVGSCGAACRHLAPG